VGKNPGSAKAGNPSTLSLQKIRLDGDKLLPTVRNIVLKAYTAAGKQPPRGSYIQVLNIFYLCDPVLSRAINSINRHTNLAVCQTETQSFPWVWYVWGNENPLLSEFKTRFSGLNTKVHFYFDKNEDVVVSATPGLKSFAKHTQGLKQEKIIAYKYLNRFSLYSA